MTAGKIVVAAVVDRGFFGFQGELANRC